MPTESKKIVVRQFDKEDFQADWHDSDGNNFTGMGITKELAVGNLILVHAAKLGIEIETIDHQGRVVDSRKPAEQFMEIKCPECEGYGGHEIEQICPKCRDRGTIFVSREIK